MRAKEEEGGPARPPLETADRVHILEFMIRFTLRTLSGQIALVALAAACIFEPGTVLAQQCPLTAPLTIKDTQDGFAGQTGTVWTIAPDCTFSVARQVGPRIDPMTQGRLTPAQEGRLKEQLARAAVADMPAQIGSRPPVNARRITVSYGEKTSVLLLPPGGGDFAALQGATGEAAAGRLLQLADTVKGLTGS
jgi:hypothetical protein